MKKKNLVIMIGVVGLVLLIGSVTYAWFNYYGEGSDRKLIMGDLYLNLNGNSSEISINNIYPETKEEARARDDNVLSFSIDGKNTTGKTIYYEVKLIYGDEMEEPYKRFNDKDLRFDLIEIVNNEEKYLVKNRYYNEINNKRIWVDTVDAETTSNVTRYFKLRMWLDEDVLISDTDSNANYTAHSGENDFKYHYASVKVAVYGDLEEKELRVCHANIDNLAQGTEVVKGQYVYRYKQEYSPITSSWVNVVADGCGVRLTDEALNTTNLVLEENCTSINNKPIVKMRGMFYESVSQYIDINNLDTSNVISFESMFQKAENLTTLDLRNFDTGEVTTMYAMFGGCFSLTSISINSFNTSKVEDMNGMFQSCTKLESLNLKRFDTSNVKLMGYMFSGCSKLTSLDLSSFDTSKVTNMNSMFQNCGELVYLNLSGIDTDNVKNMANMFAACSKIVRLDLSSFDTSRVTNMNYMFQNCRSLAKIYVSNLWTTTAVISSDAMLNNASNIVGEKGTVYNSNYVDKTYARIDNPPDEPGYFTYKESPVNNG